MVRLPSTHKSAFIQLPRSQVVAGDQADPQQPQRDSDQARCQQAEHHRPIERSDAEGDYRAPTVEGAKAAGVHRQRPAVSFCGEVVIIHTPAAVTISATRKPIARPKSRPSRVMPWLLIVNRTGPVLT